MMDKLSDCILWLKIITIWDKVSGDIKSQFDSEPACYKNYFQLKKNSHGDEATGFYDKSQLDFNHTCLAVIS